VKRVWWNVALVGLLLAALSFMGVLVCMLRYNRTWMKRFIVGFLVSFAIAFISVGLAGIQG